MASGASFHMWCIEFGLCLLRQLQGARTDVTCFYRCPEHVATRASPHRSACSCLVVVWAQVAARRLAARHLRPRTRHHCERLAPPAIARRCSCTFAGWLPFPCRLSLLVQQGGHDGVATQPGERRHPSMYHAIAGGDFTREHLWQRQAVCFGDCGRPGRSAAHANPATDRLIPEIVVTLGGRVQPTAACLGLLHVLPPLFVGLGVVRQRFCMAS